MDLPRASAPTSLWQEFLAVAERSPDSPALLFAEGDVSFSELLADAERCADWVSSAGFESGSIIALQLPKRRETYALWLGCLRQGLVYVFLDPANPPSRIEQMVRRVRPALLVTCTDAQNPFGEVLCLGSADDGTHWLKSLPKAVGGRPPADVDGPSPVYVMFTSGSTGEPKGVVIAQQGVLALMAWARSLIANVGAERFSNLNPLHFDNSVFDLYCGLLNGAALVPVETGALPNPLDWVKLLRRGRASVVFAVPTLFLTLDHLRLLTRESLADVRVFLFGGEGFPIAALRRFHERFREKARLINVYGPTETSCICSSIEVGPVEIAAAGEGLLPLGQMHSGFEHTILDESGASVPPGGVGELWIGGAGVGLGYYASPDQTALRFRPDPRPGAYIGTWYRSGDLVREDANGLLWFQGRADNQVKVRGHRVELEEIDRVVERLAGVRQAVCVILGAAELHLVFTAEFDMDLNDVRRHCETQLPAYMRPVRFIQVAALPTNANGKTDRAGVRALVQRMP